METKNEKLKRVRAEMEKARTWDVKRYSIEEHEEMISQLEYSISLLDCEPPDDEPVKCWRFWHHDLQSHSSRPAPIQKRVKDWCFAARANLAAALLTIALLLGCNASAWAVVAEDQAVHAILGEARGEGYRGMYAVACAIRNRGHLKGVYGLKADVSDASDKTVQEAYKAWQMSGEGIDITLGADHWENVKTFGVPYWAINKTPTAIIGRHAFYQLNPPKAGYGRRASDIKR